MNEQEKNHKRRTQNGDYEKFFKGSGLDIGHGRCAPIMGAIGWERHQGNLLDHYSGPTFDFIHSSHVLEHLDDPVRAFREWWSLLKPNGYIITTVPDFRLYEHSIWPSIFNMEHRSTWSPSGIPQFLHECRLSPGQLIRIQLNDENFDYENVNPTFDQTLHHDAQAEVEFIVKKLPTNQELWNEF